MCSFVTESCAKTQNYIFYLKTVNIQNEMNVGKAENKAKNYISLLLKVTFWWYNFEKVSNIQQSLTIYMVVDILNVYIYNEKFKLFSAIPSSYKKINIDDLSYQFNSLANFNTEYLDC